MVNAETIGIVRRARSFNVLEDPLTYLIENFLDIFVLLCAALYKWNLVLLSKLLTLRKRHLPLKAFNIWFITNKDHCDRTLALTYLPDPTFHIVKTPPVINSICQNGSMCTSEISLGYCLKSLLASCIPDLHFNLYIANFDCLDSEIYSDCGNVVGPEFLLNVSQKNVRLSYGSVSYNNSLG